MRWALVLMLATACSSPTGPELPAASARMAPLPMYSEWWLGVMKQVDVHKEISHVRWYRVEGGPWYSTRYRRMVRGVWIPDGRIYLASGSEADENVVKHEMLHELLGAEVGHDHPAFDAYPIHPVR